MPGIEIQGGDSNLGAPDSQARKVWFTGYANDESTQGTSVPVIGGVVCFSEAGGFKGRGKDVVKPETAVLGLFAGIIVDMPDWMSSLAVAGDGSGVTAGKVKPGWITIVSAASAIQARTIANMTKYSTTPFPLGPSNGSWALKAVTSSIASGAANFAYLAGTCAMALETSDTSAASEPGTLKYVKLGGVVGGLET